MKNVSMNKVVFVGRTGSGKTSLIVRFVSSVFSDGIKPTIGAAFSKKTVEVVKNGTEKKEVTLAIWDTAGDERYESMAPLYYRNASAAIVCFDITDRESYQKMDFWIGELLRNLEKCNIYICATKKDLLKECGGLLKRAVDKAEVSAYVKRVKAKYVETSSKRNYYIDDLFKLVAADFVDSCPCSPKNAETTENSVKVEKVATQQKNGCCY